MESINWLLSLILLVLAAILITLLDGWSVLRDLILYIFGFVFLIIKYLLQFLFGLIGLVWPYVLGFILFVIFIRLLTFILESLTPK